MLYRKGLGSLIWEWWFQCQLYTAKDVLSGVLKMPGSLLQLAVMEYQAKIQKKQPSLMMSTMVSSYIKKKQKFTSSQIIRVPNLNSVLQTKIKGKYKISVLFIIDSRAENRSKNTVIETNSRQRWSFTYMVLG